MNLACLVGGAFWYQPSNPYVQFVRIIILSPRVTVSFCERSKYAWWYNFSMCLVSFEFTLSTLRWTSYVVAELVEALRYKPEGHGFDSRWFHWNFSLTFSSFNRNE
jgi:hypothetical protein